MKSIILFFLILHSFFAHSIDLSQRELSDLNEGKMIRKVQWLENEVWPKVTIYKVLNHSPSENFNIFKNFENHKTFIPDMKESKILKKVSETRTQMYFEMNMPWPVNKSTHVTENHVIRNGDEDITIEWKLVKAELLKDTKGFLNFSEFHGKTLMTYENHITPNSPLASMFKNRVADDVEKSVLAISKHLENSLKNRSSL